MSCAKCGTEVEMYFHKVVDGKDFDLCPDCAIWKGTQGPHTVTAPVRKNLRR